MRKQIGILLGVTIAAGSVFAVGSEALPAAVAGRQTAAPPISVQPQPAFKPDTPENQKLFEAVKKGDPAAVKAALTAGADPETVVYPGGAKEPGIAVLFLPVYKIGENPVRPGEKVHADHDRYLAVFRTLADRVRDVNLPQGHNGQTLLMAAVEVGDLATVRSLVERGADLEGVTKTQDLGGRPYGGQTALYQAEDRNGDSGEDPDPIVVYLLGRGANADHVCADGSTVLMRAAQHKKIDTVRLLLNKGADPSRRDSSDFTALRWASVRGEQEIVALLEKRTRLNLWEAAALGNVARVKELLVAGADPNANRPMPASLNGMPGDRLVGETPLAAAAKSNDPATVQALLDAGADVRYIHPRTGKTALHNAAAYNSTEVIPLLIARGADVNAVALRRDANGKPEASQYYAAPPDEAVVANRPSVFIPDLLDTPLVCAVEGANSEAVILLLRSGVKMAANDQGNVALRRLMHNSGQEPRRPREQKADRLKKGEAAMDAQDAILEALIKAGADIDKTGALAVAVERGQPGVMEYLLAQGASPNVHAPGTDGDETALMAAIGGIASSARGREMLRDGALSGPEESDIAEAENTARACLQLLLKAGADVNEAARGTGTTPLMTAIECDLLPVAGDLLKRGAKLEATDAAGRTALLRLAAEGENLAGMRWLLQKGADPNRADKDGKTALLLAIDDGANARWEEWQKETASDRELYIGEPPKQERPNPTGHPEAVKLLLRSGADGNVVAKDGKTTALTLARKNGFKAVEVLLGAAK